MVVTQLDDARPPLPACGVELVFVGSLFLQRQGTIVLRRSSPCVIRMLLLC
jgi:hypothetical protein